MEAVVQKALTISDADTLRLAGEYAELRGMGIADAVKAALEAQVRREREVQDRAAKILALGREIRAYMTEPVSSDHSWLYDENGLPA